MDGSTPEPKRDDLDNLLALWQDEPTPRREADLWEVLLPFIEVVVRRWAFARGVPSTLVQDLTQNMAYELLKKDRHVLRQWNRTMAPARPYLRLVIWRRLSDGSSADKLLSTADGTIPDIADDETPEALLTRAAQNALIRDLVYDVATPTERQVYQLVYEEELSLEEAAVRLGKTPDAVAQRHRSLKERLRPVLGLLGRRGPPRRS